MALKIVTTFGSDANMSEVVENVNEKLPQSVIQNSLDEQTERLGVEYGGGIASAVKNTGNHLSAMAHVLSAEEVVSQVHTFIPNRNNHMVKGELHISDKGVKLVESSGREVTL